MTTPLDPNRFVRLWSDSWHGRMMPFSDEQVHHIIEAAGLARVAAPCAEKLQDALGQFLACSSAIPSAARLASAKEARASLIEAKRAAGTIFDEAELGKLDDLVRRCDEIITAVGRVPQLRRRNDGLASRALALRLGEEFERIFGTPSTSTKQGPFHRYLGAFLEAAKTNVDVKLPEGEALLELRRRQRAALYP